MDFELEWELTLFREEQPSLFDEFGERYSATPIGDKTAKKMLNIINLLESALSKQPEQQSSCHLPQVSNNEVAGCPICKGRGEYHTGGSFGGVVQIHQCECTEGQPEQQSSCHLPQVSSSSTPFGESIKLLRDLADLQNGAPLERNRKEWEETMNQVYNFLNKWESQ
jgi:hypothetical protein